MSFAVAAALSFGIVVVSQIVKGVVGFGSALVAIPLLTFIWGPVEGIFLATSADVVGAFVLLPGVWRRLRWSLLAAMFFPTIIAQYVATDLLALIPADVFKLLLGVIVILLGLDMALRPVKPGRGELEELPERSGKVLGWAVVAGLGAGTMSGFFGTPGPPVVVFAKRLFTDQFMRAQLIAYFFPTSISLLAMLAFKGEVEDLSSMGISALIVAPAVAIGGLTGARLSKRISRLLFARIVGTVLVAAGVALMFH